MMTLEEDVTQGTVSYISSIEREPSKKTLVIRFLADPESNDVNRVLAFVGVEDFSEEEFDDEDVAAGIDVVDQLIGLDEYPEAETVRYVVHTQLREMIFRTKEKPQLEFLL